MKDTTKKALDILRKTFGVNTAVLMSEVASVRSTVIPIGIAALDQWVLGIGGIPRGQFIEIYGKEKSGKTTLVLHMIAAVQCSNCVPVIIDHKAATASDNDRAIRIGVDPENCILLPIRTSEEALIQARDVIERSSSMGVDLAFFWDDMGLSATKGNIVPEKSRKKAKSSTKIAEKAKVMWDFVRALSGLCYEHKVPMIIVNHLTALISTSGFQLGPRFTTIGGGSTRAASRIRLKLTRTEFLKYGTQKWGQVVLAETEANAFAPPFRKAKLCLSFADGYVDNFTTILNAMDAEIVKKDRGGYRYVRWSSGAKSRPLDAWSPSDYRSVERDLWSGEPKAIDQYEEETDDDTDDEDTDDLYFEDEVDDDGSDYSV